MPSGPSRQDCQRPALVGVPIGYWSGAGSWYAAASCDPRLLHRSREHLLRDTADGDGVGWDTATQGWVLSSFFIGRRVTHGSGAGGPRASGTRAARSGPLVSLFTQHYAAAASVSLAPPLPRASAWGSAKAGLPRSPALRAMDSARRTCACRGAERQRNSPRHGLGDAPYALARRRLRVAAVFYVSGLVGFVWYAFWHFTSSERLEDAPGIHPSEIAYIRAHTAPAIAKPVGAWGRISAPPRFGCSCSTTSVRTGVST